MTSVFQNLFDKPERLFLLIGAFFGIIAIFLMPVLTAPDEGAHFWVGYSMFSKSQQVPKDLLISPENSVQDVSSGRYIHDIIEHRANLGGSGYSLNYNKQIFINNKNASRSVYSGDVRHLPQALGILVGRMTYPSVGVMVILGRVVNMVFYLLCIYFIIKYVLYGKLVFMFVALFPMLIQQAASLSYDVFNAVAIFAWMAFMINLYAQKTVVTRKQIAVSAALALALVVSKPSNVLLLLFLPFLPRRVYSSLSLFSWLKKHLQVLRVAKYTLIAVSVLFTLIVAALVYKDIHSHGISLFHFIRIMFNTLLRPEVNGQLDPIVTSGIVGNFGWLWYRLPEWIVILQLIVLTVALLADKAPKKVVDGKLAIVSLSTLLLSVLAITTGMYLLWTLQPFVAGAGANYAQGIQGRYFTPLLVLLVPLFAYIQRSFFVQASRKAITSLVVGMSIFSLSTYLLLTYVFFYTTATGIKDVLFK